MVDPAPRLRGKLGDFFTVSKEKGVADLPMLSVTMRNGLVRRDSLDRKMDSELEDGDHLRVRPGDIAYNMMRMWQGASGLATEDGIVSPAYVVVRPKNAVDPLFASFWFKSQRMIYLFWAYSYGLTSDRLRLYGKDFTQIPVELPPLPDQRRIAEVLSDFDRAIEATDALVEAKQRRKRGLMQRAFGDVHNPFAIVGDELGKLCKIQYGSGVDAASYSPGGPSWVIGTSGVMGFSNVGTKIGPAIILGRKGTLNKPFFVPEGQMFSAIDTTFVVTAKQKLKVLYHFLTHLDLSKLNAASGVPSVSSETLQAQQVPTLTEFQGELLDSIDAEIEQLTAQGRRIRDQRRGLMQRLLSEPTRQSKSVTEGIAA